MDELFCADRPPLAAAAVLRQVILKIAQRCNLNCSYCYVYHRGDNSWAARPPVISDAVVAKLADRITEHCEAHHLSGFTIELHGGEPLLVGKSRMQRIVDILRQRCSFRLRFEMQTNGLLLDRDWVELLAANEIAFGISLDGPPEFADRYRIMRGTGAGSTESLLRIIATLRAECPAFDDWFGGVLCVINPEIDGGELVDWFVAQGFDSFDFLLPNGNRSNLPPGWSGIQPYRRFLLSAFERWYSLGAKAPRIRKFELMLGGLMGGSVLLDSLGGDLRLLCVVESDGSIGINDVSRICGGPFSHDTLNIFDHRIDAHIEHYRIMELQQPPAICRTCRFFAGCGGGYLPHRYDGTAFDNPSLYCDALYALSERMMQALRQDLPDRFWRPIDAAAMNLG